MLIGVMSNHLRGGGLIVAATHGPLGLAPEQTRELNLAPARVEENA